VHTSTAIGLRADSRHGRESVPNCFVIAKLEEDLLCTFRQCLEFILLFAAALLAAAQGTVSAGKMGDENPTPGGETTLGSRPAIKLQRSHARWGYMGMAPGQPPIYTKPMPDREYVITHPADSFIASAHLPAAHFDAAQPAR
jgi:hypothetical protein